MIWQQLVHCWKVVGLVAVGFEAMSLAASGLAAFGLKQGQVHHPDATEPPSGTKTAECNAAKPDVQKAAGFSISYRCNNLPILRIN